MTIENIRRFAVFGSRNPTREQVLYCKGALTGLAVATRARGANILLEEYGLGVVPWEKSERTESVAEPIDGKDIFLVGLSRGFILGNGLDGVEIISGCSEGIDELAITTARQLGLHTIGCPPHRDFNKTAESCCDKIVLIEDLAQKHIDAAKKSVKEYYGDTMFLDEIKSNFIGHLDKDGKKLHERSYLVVRWSAYAIIFPSSSRSGGGAGQGMRMCQAFGISFDAVTNKTFTKKGDNKPFFFVGRK